MALPSTPSIVDTIGNVQTAVDGIDLPKPPGVQQLGQMFMDMFSSLGDKAGISNPFPFPMPSPSLPPSLPAGLPALPALPAIAKTLKLPF